MKRSCFVLVFLLFFSLIISSCATKVAEVNGQSYSDKDEVLLNLDVGMLEFYNQNYPEAIEKLTKAEEKIFEYYTKSVSQNIESFLTNDLVIDYPGEDYEDIYINLFKAISYYLNNQWEEGFHELNAYKRKANLLGQKHSDEIEKARKEADLENAVSASVEFHDSALAEYLFMLYYRSIYDRSQVEFAAKMLEDVFVTSPKIYNFPVPKSIEDEVEVSMFDTRLNFLVYSGTAPYKGEIITRSYDGDFSLALPVLIVPDEDVASITVLAKNKATGEVYKQYLEKIEDVGNIAQEVFKTREDLIYLKSIARAVAKSAVNTTTAVAGEIMMDSDDPTISTIGTVFAIASLAGRLFAEETEHADTRHSRYLPGRADVGGLSVDPGVYNIIVQYRNPSGKVIFTDKKADVQVEAGKLNLVTSSSTMREYNNSHHRRKNKLTIQYY